MGVITAMGGSPRKGLRSWTPEAEEDEQNEVVLVADSQFLFAQTLGEALASRGFVVHSEHPTAGLAALKTILDISPGVVLLDYWMTGVEGPAIAAMVNARQPEVKVILLSWFHGTREIKKALECGAVGFLPKGSRVENVVEAIKWAKAGQSPVFPQELEEMVKKIESRGESTAEAWKRLGSLTPRELEILQLLALGHPLKYLADKLCISPATLRTHINKILVKTETHSQIEALSLARSHGLIQT